jgi:hypothetical protein
MAATSDVASTVHQIECPPFRQDAMATPCRSGAVVPLECREDDFAFVGLVAVL